jgi:hypothetical protein
VAAAATGRARSQTSRWPGTASGIVCGWAVRQDAGRELDRDQQGEGWPAGDDPADGSGLGRNDVAAILLTTDLSRFAPGEMRGAGAAAALISRLNDP